MKEAKNFLNVRVQSCKHSEIKSRIQHNVRAIKTRNIDSSKTVANRNIVVIDFRSDSNKTIRINQEDNIKSKEVANYYLKEYQDDRDTHDLLYKANNPQHVRDSHSSWMEAIFSFSEAIDTDLGTKYSQADLIECAKKAANTMAKAMNTEVTMMTLHLDEIRPHFQLFFKNYGDRGQSILFENRTRDKLSALQDILFDNFKELGMKRGIKKVDKDCGIYDYQTTKAFKAKQLYKQTQSIEHNKITLTQQANVYYATQEMIENSMAEKLELEDALRSQKYTMKQAVIEHNRKISSMKKKYKEMQTLIKSKIVTLKEERASISKEVSLSKDEKKVLYSQITEAQTTLRDAKKKIVAFCKLGESDITKEVIQTLHKELHSISTVYLDENLDGDFEIEDI